MKNFNNQTFIDLASIHTNHCVSIYMPTHISNTEGEGYDMDRITLKNQIKEVEKQLQTFKVEESEIKKIVKPLNNLFDDEDFWAHQSNGLAIFIYNETVKFFNMPISFKESVSVDSHLYITPLVNLLSDTKSCILLKLNLDDVELYQVNSTEIFRIEVSDLIPSKMTDTVGEDYEEKQLEGRVASSRSGQNYDSYHGHGRSNDTVKKEEALRYFQQIDNGLQRLLNENKLPLVVACVDYLFPIYEEANSYNFLKKEHISGSPTKENLNELANSAMDIILKDKDENLKKIIEDFGSLVTEGKSTDKLENVIPAAVGGRVHQLLVKENTKVWGKYIQARHSIETKEVRHIGDSDLINLAVIETIKNGGEVLLVNEINMPTPKAELAAILRF